MTPFEEGDDDEDIPACYVPSYEDHSSPNTSERSHGPPTQSRAKKIQEQVNCS